jgi:hypothetical protein
MQWTNNANLGHSWDEFVISELMHDKIYICYAFFFAN